MRRCLIPAEDHLTTPSTSLSIEPTATAQGSPTPGESGNRPPYKLRGWVLLSYLPIAFVVGPSLLIGLGPEWLIGAPRPPLFDALSGLLIFAILAALLAWPLSRGGIRLRSLLGALSAREIRCGLLAGVGMAGVSQCCAYLLFVPISYLAPSLASSVLIESEVRLFYTGEDAYVVANVLQFAVVVLAAPFCEELLFRGLLLSIWEQRWRARRAVIFTSVVFAMLHTGLLGPFALGVAASLVFLTTRKLGVSILLHAAHNFVFWAMAVAGATVWDLLGPAKTLEQFQQEWWLGALGLALGLPILYAAWLGLRPEQP
jgi:membrane protease YdiL (CAAX protease family)